MAGMNRVSWEDLAVILEKDPGFANRVMRVPREIPPPDKTLLEQLLFLSKDAGLERLFARFLVCGALLAGKELPESHETILKSCLPSAPDVLAKARWITFPLLACKEETGCSVCWVCTGIMSESAPDSFGPEFSDQSRRAFLDAVDAVSCMYDMPRPGIVAWPLLPDGQGEITGASLGLPAALAVHFLLKGEKWPVGLYATGRVDRAGRILPVGMLEDKGLTVRQADGVLLSPVAEPSFWPGRSDFKADGRVITCSALSHALKAADLFPMRTDTGVMSLCLACSSDPALLLQHFCEIPLHLLECGCYKDVLSEISSNPQSYIKRFAVCMRWVMYLPERARFIADLFSPEQIVQVCKADSALAGTCLEAVTARIGLFNYAGETRKIVPWMEAAEKIRNLSPHSALATYLNNRIIAQRHNRYDFRPELPSDFVQRMQVEEQIFGLKGEENWLLGAMHGTVAQNYGFCGAKWVEKSLDHIKRGTTAFGNRYAQDGMRLLNYKVYCLLDVGDHHRAVEVLARYLDLGRCSVEHEPDSVFETALREVLSGGKDSAFRFACAVRYLADTRAAVPESDLEKALLASCQNQGHPWQLAAFNCARIAVRQKNIELGYEFSKRSIEICLNGSATMQIMAVLSLSVMHLLKAVSRELEDTARHIKSVMSDAKTVNVSHFKDMAQTAGLDEMLNMVASTPERWFPFSYR